MATIAEIGTRQEYLSAEREQELVTAMKSGCMRSRDQLVLSHVRIVTAMASKYRNFHDFDALMSAGILGLVIAADKFDPSKEVRFSTYCVHWVRSELLKLTQKGSNLVSFGDGSGKKRAFFGLGRAKRQLGITGEPTDAEVSALAAELQVTENDIRVTMARKRTVASLNAPVGSDGEGHAEHIDYLVDDAPVPQDEALIAAEEKESEAEALETALALLKPRERDILTKRRLNEAKSTLEEVSQEYGISRERVRQIEEAAFEKVQAHVTGKKKPRAPKAKPASEAVRRKRLEFVRENVDRMRPVDMAQALNISPKTIGNYLGVVRRERLPLAA